MILSAMGERQRNMKGGGGRREAGPERKGRQEEDWECGGGRVRVGVEAPQGGPRRSQSGARAEVEAPGAEGWETPW